jgi:hypothetical protein
MYLKQDEDEKQAPEKFAQKIQRQFNSIPQSEYMKKIEYFLFGALSALRNHHYLEALNFISQAPFICTFGEQQAIDFEALVVFEMLKMAEVKLLTKVGRPEQAVIQLNNRFF